MTSEHDFNHEGAYDFTNDFTASLEQDYITLFMYQKGHQYDVRPDHRRKKTLRKQSQSSSPTTSRRKRTEHI
jgi:hypothetical protein